MNFISINFYFLHHSTEGVQQGVQVHLGRQECVDYRGFYRSINNWCNCFNDVPRIHVMRTGLTNNSYQVV